MAPRTTTRKKRTHRRRRKLRNPENTTTKYTSYRKDGVYDWEINTGKEIDERNPHPDIYKDEEFERIARPLGKCAYAK